MLTVLALLLTGSPAHAQDCDAKAIAKQIDEVSPVQMAKKFVELAECDEKAAADKAEAAMAKVLYDDDGKKASLLALKVGARKPVMDWVDQLEPNYRTDTVMWLGEQCNDVPAVGEFFVAASSENTENFLKERWYRGMSKCRTEPVQALLKDIVEKNSLDLDRERRFGFVEVYARNLGKDSIPHLKSEIAELGDPKDIRLILNAFGDAANVGSLEGINAEAAKAAVEALTILAPTTHPDAIEQMRNTLLALGDEAKANEVVKYRWADRLKGETYEYAVVATEDIACKNGKKMVVLHHGRLTDVSQWPEKLQEDLEAQVKKAWGLNSADKCKGTAQFKIEISPSPVASDDDYAKFVEPHQKAFTAASKDAWKAEEIVEDTKSFY